MVFLIVPFFLLCLLASVLKMVGNIFLDLFSYLVLVLKSTLIHLLLFLGPILLLAYIMNFISKRSSTLGIQVFGERVYIYGFASLGTAVHELGHAVFALLFAHKIEKIVLFSPNNMDGTLGYVNHSYNKKSIYQNIGNFFIGIGPIIFGPLVISIIVYFIAGRSILEVSGFKVNLGDINTTEDFKVFLSAVIDSFVQMGGFVFTLFSTSLLKAILLLYFIFSIGSSVTLSMADIKGAKKGLYYFMIVLLIFNLFTLWIGDFARPIISIFMAASYSIFMILIFSIITTLVVNLVLIFVLQIKKMVFKRA